VRDVDRGRGDAPLELLQLVPRGGPELGVKVRERLVQQEHGRLAHHGARQRHPLALTARELSRLAREQPLDPEERRGPLDLLRNLVSRQPLGLQGKGDVLEHRHVRVEGVGLEHHGDLAGAGGQVVDGLPPDQDLARRRSLQSGDDPEQGRLPAPRRPQEDEELALLGG
jgi:hypothetical protein